MLESLILREACAHHPPLASPNPRLPSGQEVSRLASQLECGELPWGRLVNQLIRAIRWQRTVARAVGENVLASQLTAHISQL